MKKIILSFLLLTLASCASIPSSSEVQIIPNTVAQIDDESFRVIVRPPSEGMDQLEIVQGFLAAQADLTANFEIARKYLVPEYSSTWRSRSTQLIDPTSLKLTLLTDNLVAIEYLQLGSLSIHGNLTLFDEPVLVTANISLTQSGANWRVSQAPDVTFMSMSDVQRNYSAYSVYFFDVNFQRMVPVVYWLPSGDASIATRLARALIAGPQDGLEASLRSAIPAGTALELDAAVPVNGVLNIQLNPTALQAVGETRQAMFAQFARTLNSVASTFQIRIGNTSLEYKQSRYIRSDDFDFYFQIKPATATPAISITATSFQSGSLVKVEDSMQVQPASVFTASNDLKYAATSNGRVVRVYDYESKSSIENLVFSAIALHFDRTNQLWMLNDQGELKVRKINGEIVDVLGAPSDLKIQDFSIAPDGNQILLQIPFALGNQIRIGYILESTGSIQMTNLKRVERHFDDVLEADWGVNSTLFVLARAGSEQVRLYQLGRGEVVPRSIATPVEFARLSVTPGWPLLTETAVGAVWKFENGQWRLTELASNTRYVD